MLIEFSVQNFRSIKEKQTLSMVASTRDNTLPSHLIDPQTPGLSKTKLLKSAAIYGANASGKSNIFKAAQFMRDYIVKSATEIKTGMMKFGLHVEKIVYTARDIHNLRIDRLYYLLFMSKFTINSVNIFLNFEYFC